MIEFSTKLRIFIISLACLCLIGWIDPATDKNEEGRQRYNEGEYGEAISKFTDAQLHLPESDSLNFNIANTHYKVGKLPEAEKSYKGILDSKDVTLKAKANYNMGNTMYKQGKFNEALDFYKKAIKLTDKESGVNGDEIKGVREDAKYNYEFVQKKMEEMKKEQQEREEKEEQEKQDQEKPDDQKQGEGQEEKQEEKKPDQQEQQQQEKEQEKQDKGTQENEPSPENEESPSQPYEKKEMTKEEAERILDALRQSERSAREMQEKQDKPAGFMIEKNW
ncbi:MAG: tetratricopeptide repeat protein [Candidatus Scalindua sp.]